MTITGLPTVIANLERVGHAGPDQGAAALYRQGEIVMGKSKDEFVPVDEAILKNSGFVNLPQTQGDRITVTLGYGGAAADYAVKQHEDLTLRHTVGGPKYLERPVLDAVPRLAAAIAADIRLDRAVR